MNTRGWIAVLLASGALVAFMTRRPAGSDLIGASADRVYPRAASDPRPQALPAGAGTDTLRTRRILGDSLAFASIYDLAVVGSKLLVLDARGSERLAVIDRGSGSVRSFGRYGEGPGEFLWPVSVDPVPEGGDRAWVYDIQNGRSTLYDLADTALEHVRLVRSPINLYQVHRLGDTLVANGLFPRETLRFYTEAEDGAAFDQVGAAGKTPFGRELADVVMLLGRTFLAIHPSRDRLVAAYHFRNQLDFHDRSGRLLRSVAGPVDFDVRYRVVPDPREGINRFVMMGETRYAYLDVEVTRDRVYALFSGRPRERDDAYAADQIHVFTWDGELVDVIHLDTDVFRLVVDPATRTAYGARSLPYPGIVDFGPVPDGA